MKNYNLLAIYILVLTFSSSTQAKCANPIPDSVLENNLSWSELKGIQASAALNRNIEATLPISSGIGDRINYDYYSITMDSEPSISAKEFFRDFRINLSEYIFFESTYSMKPYSTNDLKKWESTSPGGALITFVLAGLSDIIEIENGDVVVTCSDDTSFVFSTVKTEKNGFHPVSGNRGFGIVDNHDGSWTIYTKAVDRMSDYYPNKVIVSGVGNKDTVFELGHKIWVGLLENIERKFTEKNPRSKIIYSKRYAYPH